MVGARSWLAGLMFSLVQTRRRSFALIVALSLGAAACGAGDDAAPSLTLAPQVSSTNADDSGDESATSAPDDSAPDDSAPDDPDSTLPDESVDEAAAPDLVNLFPDIDVLDIANGSTVNLAAALGGFDKPTLLWFWAPH